MTDGREPVFLGANIYLWSQNQQDRLLVSLLGPQLRKLCHQRQIKRFWFSRFDARGPHVFLLTEPLPGCEGQVRTHLSATLDTLLEQDAEPAGLGHEELLARHRACRGKALCAVDREPGMAENVSYRLFSQLAGDYPHAPFAGLPRSNELIAALGDLTAWSLEQLERESAGAAAAWIAALARQLHNPWAADYWHYHALSLLPNLDERIAGRGEGRTAPYLASLLGTKRCQQLANIWAADASADPSPPLTCWLELLELGLQNGDDRYHRALREILHILLTQLGLPVREQTALVLYAWYRSL